MGGSDSALTAFQLEVAQLFFSLPASDGFLLAGGAALVAQKLSSRPTHDLDLFTRAGASTVDEAYEQFVPVAQGRGWAVETVKRSSTFCRLLIHGPEDLLVDLALDAAPSSPAHATIAGPSFAPAELAGRKLIALFDRAAARDFVDVYALSAAFDKNTLIKQAASVDAGFDTHVLAQMIAQLERYSDQDLDLGGVDVPQLRAFFARWLAELRGTD